MKYIVIFRKDRQIIEVPQEDVLLGEYEAYTPDDWMREHEGPFRVSVIYDKTFYAAAILQVC